MWKRFAFEWKRSLPFFVLLWFMASLLWIWLSSVGERLATNGQSLMFALVVALGFSFTFLFACIAFVIFDVHREFQNPEGLLTFLTPIRPWKVMLAKWVNLVLSFGLAFLCLRLVMLFVPYDAGVIQDKIQLVNEGIRTLGLLGALNTISKIFTDLFFFGLVFFVMRWTLVLMIGYWVMARTEAWKTRGQIRRGKTVLRFVLIALLLIGSELLLSFLISLAPTVLTPEGSIVVGTKLAFPYISIIGTTSVPVVVPTAIDPENIVSGLPLISVAYTLLATAFAFWRANAAWRAIDR